MPGMNPAAEHFIYAPEVNYGTFVAPTKALPVISFNLESDRPIITPVVTGQYRGQLFQIPGEKPVAGQLVTYAWPNNLITLIKTFMTRCTSTLVGAATTYRHKFTFDDAAALGSFSAEAQYGTDKAHFGKGLRIVSLGISCRSKEPVQLTFGLVGQDEAWNGGNWEDAAGSAAPASPTTPVPYAASIGLPFIYYQGALLLGGTVSEVTGELIVAGGVAQAWVEACEITIELPSEQVYPIQASPTAQALREGERNVKVKMDLDWVGDAAARALAARANTETVLALNFTGATCEAPATKYEMDIVVPRLVPLPGETKATVLSGDKKRRVAAAGFKGLIHATTTRDFGLAIQTTEAAP